MSSVVASGQDSYAPDPVATDAVAPKSVELTILMPCLNEAETIVACVRKAREFLRASDIVEVLIADNGSTDGSQQLAAREGARVLLVSIVLASLNFTLMKFWAFAERA